MNLADKWNIISSIWHTTSDLDFLSQELTVYKNKTICDIAAGNGFHSIHLRRQGFKVVAVDGSPQNISQILTNMSKRKVEYPVIYSKWQNLNLLKDLKFDIILCLGTSITYYDCWKENTPLIRKMNWIEIGKILENFKCILNKSGKIFIGIASYYLQNKTEENLIFSSKIISGSKYQMRWKLKFDWQKRIKRFKCTVIKDGTIYFDLNLNSHLFTAEEFFEVAQKHFNKCKLINVKNNLNDKIIVCHN